LRLKAGPNDEGRRIDRILRKVCAELPISAIYRLLRKGFVLLDGKPVRPESRVRVDQIIEVRGIEADGPYTKTCKMRRTDTVRFDIERKIAVLYEGQGILALNKPAGITAQEDLGALVSVYLEGKLAPSLSFSPGPLHRLDKEASGLIVFGTSLDGARSFSGLMQRGLLQKTYIALLEGCLNTGQVWQDHLVYFDVERRARIVASTQADSEGTAVKSKYAETRVFPLKVCSGFTFAKIEIVTGRRHQIRAQAAAHGFPLYGDRKYGGKSHPPFFLHACRLIFPENCLFPHSIFAPIPEAFDQKLLELDFGGCRLNEFDAD
jgi:23S rRNA pseudouridine955/2504/2580 synthase